MARRGFMTRTILGTRGWGNGKRNFYWLSISHGMGHQGAETPTLTFPDFRSFTTHFCPPAPA